jgi:hypothetical protein
MRCSNRLRLRITLLLLLLHAGLLSAGYVRSAPEEAKTVQASVDEALAKKNVTDQLQSLAMLTETLPLAAIPEALKIASNLKPMRESVVLEYSTLKRWSELAPAEAFTAIAKLPESREKAQTIQLAADRFAQQNVQAAAAAALELPPGKSRLAATSAVAAAWAKSDGRKAMAWANALPEGEKEPALYALRFAWVHADPVGAAADVVMLPPGTTKNSLVANIAEEWTTLDASAAVKWAEGLPDGPEKEVALSNTARTMADKDPVAAANFALGLTPAELRQNAVVAVVTNWATLQPKDAAEWLVGQDDPNLQRGGFSAVMNFWAAIAPLESAAWVRSLKPQPARDIAIQAYAQAVAPWAPDLGLKLIAELAPEIATQPAAAECARQWLSLDPVAARKWIEASKLPDALKAQWLSPAQAPPH